MKQLIIVLAWNLISLSAYAEEISVPITSGQIIGAGNPFGQIFIFPSEQMDDIFFYYACGWEDFGNSIYFYDFQTSRRNELVVGGNDDGRGRLINSLTGESLLGDTPEEKTSGQISKLFLHDDGSLIFQTEINTRHKICIKPDRNVHISETTLTDQHPDFTLTIDYAKHIDNVETELNYKTTIQSTSVNVNIRDEHVDILKDNITFRITGMVPLGIQVSQDTTKLGVFAKVTILDLSWKDDMTVSWNSDQEKRKHIQKMEDEVKDKELFKKLKSKFLAKIINVIVVYDLENLLE